MHILFIVKPPLIVIYTLTIYREATPNVIYTHTLYREATPNRDLHSYSLSLSHA